MKLKNLKRHYLWHNPSKNNKLLIGLIYGFVLVLLVFYPVKFHFLFKLFLLIILILDYAFKIKKINNQKFKLHFGYNNQFKIIFKGQIYFASLKKRPILTSEACYLEFSQKNLPREIKSFWFFKDATCDLSFRKLNCVLNCLKI